MQGLLQFQTFRYTGVLISP